MYIPVFVKNYEQDSVTYCIDLEHEVTCGTGYVSVGASLPARNYVIVTKLQYQI
jgi:hypothetical protein